MIQEFIQQATKGLGIDESSAKSATGGILKLIQDQADGNDSQELFGKLPGALELMRGAGSASGAASSGLGGLASAASSLVGGKLGGAMGVFAMLQKSGLSGDQAGSFASMFFKFAQSKVGGDLVGRILGKIPELQKLVG